MTTSRSLVLLLVVVSLAVFANSAIAIWKAPAVSAPEGNVPPALNTGLIDQTKTGGIIVSNIKVLRGGMFTKIGIGSAPADKIGGINASGDIRADKFCLGTRPSPEGCITSWNEGFGFSGGQANYLFRWITGATMGTSSISELGSNVTISKTLNINGRAEIDNGTRAQSGLKLSRLAGASTASLPASNRILSIDQTTGEIILVNANCGASVVVSPAVVSASGLSCLTSPQNIALARGVTFKASGGDGTYTWTIPGGFNAYFSTIDRLTAPAWGDYMIAYFNLPGLKRAQVTSAGQTVDCPVVNVASS